MSTVFDTFLASVKSVGTACTMAMVGVYLHQRGFIDAPGKRTLALISQQVTFPLFLFTKIIHCDQDRSLVPCPDVTATLRHGWMLLLWPVYVVSAGLLVGQLIARLTSTPMAQRKSVWAAVAFGNSTGLPITLLAVVHSNFPATSDLGRVDPTLFLSVYLLLYPVLQWGMGGWLLAPENKEKDDPKEAIVVNNQAEGPAPDVEAPQEHHYYEAIRDSFANNVLNGTKASNYFETHRLTSNDEGIYLSEVNLATAFGPNDTGPDSSASSVSESVGLDIGQEDNNNNNEGKPLLAHNASIAPSYQTEQISVTTSVQVTEMVEPEEPRSCSQSEFIRTLRNVSDRCFQPPVMGALLGMIVAMIHPLRGVLVDLIDRGSHAPLEWFFDGLYHVGQAAVPINMLILGCNLSNSFNRYTGKTEKTTMEGLFSNRTLLGITFGKMVVLPIVGILSAIFLRLFVLDVPEDIAASFYLVLMIVFLTVSLGHVGSVILCLWIQSLTSPSVFFRTAYGQQCDGDGRIVGFQHERRDCLCDRPAVRHCSDSLIDNYGSRDWRGKPMVLTLPRTRTILSISNDRTNLTLIHTHMPPHPLALIIHCRSAVCDDFLFQGSFDKFHPTAFRNSELLWQLPSRLSKLHQVFHWCVFMCLIQLQSMLSMSHLAWPPAPPAPSSFWQVTSWAR